VQTFDNKIYKISVINVSILFYILTYHTHTHTPHTPHTTHTTHTTHTPHTHHTHTTHTPHTQHTHHTHTHTHTPHTHTHTHTRIIRNRSQRLNQQMWFFKLKYFFLFYDGWRSSCSCIFLNTLYKLPYTKLD
jgi:hypothetical protein